MTIEKARLWIKRPLAIFAEHAGGGLVVSDGTIVETVETGREPITPYDKVFDASEHVVIPGLVNAHHHFYQTLTRTHPEALDKELFGWLQALYPIWARLTPDALRVAVRLALSELLLSGCTTAADHHYLFPVGLDNAIDIEGRRGTGARHSHDGDTRLDESVAEGWWFGRRTASCKARRRSCATANECLRGIMMPRRAAASRSASHPARHSP